MKVSTYVRLLVTMHDGRVFATPPLAWEVAETYHTQLLQHGRTVQDRDGCIMHIPPEHFMSVEYLACDDKQAA